MITVNIQDAPAQMPSLFARVLAGENVVFCKDSLPVMELKPIHFDQFQKKRKPAMGNPPFPMTFSDDAFDPLPEDMWNVFNEDVDNQKGNS